MSKFCLDSEGGDEAFVIALLGRKPRVPFAILKRCPDGCPKILKTDPVIFEENTWKPFPTMFWLICPRLKYLISRLEQASGVKTFASKLKADHGALEEFARDQQILAKERVAIAEQILRTQVPEKLALVLTSTNAAGSQRLLGLKCLHAHAANFLATGKNIVGRWVVEQVGDCETSDHCRQFRRANHLSEALK